MLVIEKIRENLGESREGGPMKDHSRHGSVGDSGIGRARRPVTTRLSGFYNVSTMYDIPGSYHGKVPVGYWSTSNTSS